MKRTLLIFNGKAESTF